MNYKSTTNLADGIDLDYSPIEFEGAKALPLTLKIDIPTPLDKEIME